jgi:acetyltransferase
MVRAMLACDLTCVNRRAAPAANMRGMIETDGRHVLADGRSVMIRPVTADDEPAERRFFACLSPRTRRLRFHRRADAVDDGLIHFYTHIDHDRHIAFLCEHEGRIVGDARCVAHPSASSCELGIVVADHWHHTGVAQLLMHAIIDAARAHGYSAIEGLVLNDNHDMLDFVQSLGFEVLRAPEDVATVRVVKWL